MSKLLDEALERYQQFKESTPPIAPPRDKYTYEEACFTMWHDGCNNTYSNMIYLIKKYEQPELTEEQEEIYRNMMLAKKYFAEGYDFVDTDCLVATTIESFINEWATTKDYMIDENFVPALRKFLNEVAE